MQKVSIKQIPNAKFSKCFWIEAAKPLTEHGLSAREAAKRFTIPKSTLENWGRAFKAGALEKAGSSQRPLTEGESELTKTRKEMAILRMENEIGKKRRRTLRRSCCKVRDD